MSAQYNTITWESDGTTNSADYLVVPSGTTDYYWNFPYYYSNWPYDRIRALEDEVNELKEKLELLEKKSGVKVIKRSPYEVVKKKK